MAFAALVGREHVDDGAGLAVAGARVSAVVRPGSAEELAACVRRAGELATPLVARGGGSKLGWGNRLSAEEVALLDTSRLVAEPELEPEEGVVHVQAGVRLADLAARAAARGMCTRLDPLHANASVGGAIAADPVSPEASLDRRLRNDLLGLDVALADGSLTRAGGRVVKNVTGFDLVRLYCGALGTLGVITAAVLRLRPLPPRVRVLRREYPDRAQALAAAGALRSAAVELAGAAVVPHPSGATLLWRLEGHERSVEAHAGRERGDDAPAADWDGVRQRVASGAAEDRARLRLGGRPSDLPGLCDELAGRAGDDALVAALPVLGLACADVPADALADVYALAGERDWALFAESLPDGVELDAFGPRAGPLALTRALKRRFDPSGLLAPGRFAGRV